MSKMRILMAAVAVLGLTRLGQASDTPGEQLPSPGVVTGSTTTVPSGTRYLPIVPGSSSGSSCQASGSCGGTNCHEKSCWECLCGFFTYHRLPYTDINTYCCGCSGPARPPLYVYFLHPPADKAPPRTLPDLSHCGHCGRDLGAGGGCPFCGK